MRACLVLAEQRQVEQNLERLCIGSHHNELGDAAVEDLTRGLERVHALRQVGVLPREVVDRSLGRREVLPHRRLEYLR